MLAEVVAVVPVAAFMVLVYVAVFMAVFVAVFVVFVVVVAVRSGGGVLWCFAVFCGILWW